MTATHESTQFKESRGQVRGARDRGAQWLLDHQRPDGALKDTDNTLATYFKSPLAFSSAGEGAAGKQLLSWVRENALTSIGDFAGTAGRGTQAHNATYANAWLIVGAQRLGDYDLAHRAVERLLQLRFDGGGFYRVTPDQNVPSPSEQDGGVYTSGLVPGTTDLLCTSMSGHACLATGRLHEAQMAGDLLCRMWEAQPNVSDGVYFQWHDRDGLVTDFSKDVADAFMIIASATKQKYFQVGIAASFLAKLYEVTGNDKYRQVACGYLDATDFFAEDRFSTPQSGKVGWGAAYVYRITGDSKYQDIARAVGDSLVTLQGGTGSWVEDSQDMSRQLEVTSEFVALLNEIEDALR